MDLKIKIESKSKSLNQKQQHKLSKGCIIKKRKEELKTALQNRIRGRIHLQRLSCQIPNNLKTESSAPSSKYTIRSQMRSFRTCNSWNDFSHANSKTLKCVFTKTVLQGEGKAIKMISKRINNEEKVEKLIREYKKERILKIKLSRISRENSKVSSKLRNIKDKMNTSIELNVNRRPKQLIMGQRIGLRTRSSVKIKSQQIRRNTRKRDRVSADRVIVRKIDSCIDFNGMFVKDVLNVVEEKNPYRRHLIKNSQLRRLRKSKENMPRRCKERKSQILNSKKVFNKRKGLRKRNKYKRTKVTVNSIGSIDYLNTKKSVMKELLQFEEKENMIKKDIWNLKGFHMFEGQTGEDNSMAIKRHKSARAKNAVKLLKLI